MNKEVFESAYLSSITYNTGMLQIDKQNGIIRNVSVCTSGKVKGHGLEIEPEFIRQLHAQGESSHDGVKARFGHPNNFGDALGTLVGVFRNFKLSADQTQVYADLFLSRSAKVSPVGNLYDYVLELAESHPKHFGTSIVNYMPKLYQYNNEGQQIQVNDYSDYIPGKSLFMSLGFFEACDLVDSPAANPAGLFNSNQLKKNSIPMKIKETIKKFFAEGSEEPQKPLAVGEPKKGDDVKFTSGGQEYSLPNGEFLITDGPLIDQVLIIKDGKVSEVQNPEIEEKVVEQMSTDSLQKLSIVAQLSIINRQLQKELDSTPASPATTVVAQGDYYGKPDDFRATHLSDQINSITKFQPKKNNNK